eukprot:s2204_g2.t2
MALQGPAVVRPGVWEVTGAMPVGEDWHVAATRLDGDQRLRWAIVATPALYWGLCRRRQSSGGFRETRRQGGRDLTVCRCAPNARSKSVLNEESAEEAIRRLSHEISEAIAVDDAARAQQAQRELLQIQLDKPSVACRHLIREDCISASALLRLGERVSIRARVHAVKKLGRWLRWPQAAKKDLVPVSIILEGLVHALRSAPEAGSGLVVPSVQSSRCGAGTMCGDRGAMHQGEPLLGSDRGAADLYGARNAGPMGESMVETGAFSREEAETFVANAETQGFELQTSRGPAYGEAERHHYRLSFDDAGYASGLWRNLQSCLQGLRVGGRAPVGLNENIRIYKYTGGDVFGKHIDGSNQTALGRTEYTLLVYLTGGDGLEGGPRWVRKVLSDLTMKMMLRNNVRIGKFGKHRIVAICPEIWGQVGWHGWHGWRILPVLRMKTIVPFVKHGETVFYSGNGTKEVLRVVPNTGMALVHRHGRECLLHESLPVRSGVKYVLRSDVVAWTAQCALFHVVRCNVEAQNVKEAARGKVARMLLDGNTDFPLCLPELTERAAKAYDAALRVSMVRCFFTQLQSLTLIDPGYGESWETYDTALLGSFAQRLGKSLYSLRSLKVFGFEDCAIKLMLPSLWMPKLRSLKMVGCCQQKQSQKAILTLINRNRSRLEELELNLWTDVIEAEDPVTELELLPKVTRLSQRVPLLPTWRHFGQLCPLLEELTFVYDQDIALNAAEVLIDVEDPSEEAEMLAERTKYIYRDAVRFAAQLHHGGFEGLAQSCPHLQVIRFKMWDNSFGYNSAPAQEHFSISWRRSENPRRPFLRNSRENNATRTILEGRAHAVPRREWTEEELEEGRDVTEDEAMAAAAAAMLQVMRCFDDASLEAELGL